MVSDEPENTGPGRALPPGTTFHHRSEMDEVQRTMREIAGVTCLIYDQTCAAESAAARKKKEFPIPTGASSSTPGVRGLRRCGEASNCLSGAAARDTAGPQAPDRAIILQQRTTPAQGFCPSFVSVAGATLKKRVGKLDRRRLDDLITHLPIPAAQLDEAPHDMLITGVGGTGVVTVGALVSMAAHLDGMASSQLDFMGFAQKGGAVLAFIRGQNGPTCSTRCASTPSRLTCCWPATWWWAPRPTRCRPCATAALASSRASTRTPPTSSCATPTRTSMPTRCSRRCDFAAGCEAMESIDAYDLSLRLLGDSIGANILLLGYAWQRALVPVSLVAINVPSSSMASPSR